jgi:uncharacterized repeat protein (TIGR03847 family)
VPRRIFVFDAPDRFVTGTVGEPGERAFFLQARKGDVVVSVGLEKVQAAALATRMAEMLAALDETGEPGDEPVAEGTEDAEPLEEPLVEMFRVGAMALAWDPETATMVIEARDATEEGEYLEVPDEAADGPDLLRVRIDAAVARAFVRRTAAVVGAGRPPCPFCGQPLDPSGHFCSRRNGQLN